MMQASVTGGARSGNAGRAYSLAPNSGNREEKGRLEFVNVTMPWSGGGTNFIALGATALRPISRGGELPLLPRDRVGCFGGLAANSRRSGNVRANRVTPSDR